MNLPNYLTKKFNRMVNVLDDGQILQEGIQELVSNSKTFSYMNEEEDLYSVNDHKEKNK